MEKWLKEKWIKIGIAGSVIWGLVILLFTEEGLALAAVFARRRLHIYDDGLVPLIAGCLVVWVISYLFYKDKK